MLSYEVLFWLAGTFSDHPDDVLISRLSGQCQHQGHRSNKHVCAYCSSFKFWIPWPRKFIFSVQVYLLKF